MKVRVIRDDCGNPYLIRITLFELFRRKDEPEDKTGGYSLKLHIILRSDADRDLHCHPWTFISWMLCGGYWEHTAIYENPDEFNSMDRYSPEMVQARKRTWIKPGTIRVCRAPYVHRLELVNPAVTLVFTFPRKREWGFYKAGGWVPWFQYKSEQEC